MLLALIAIASGFATFILLRIPLIACTTRCGKAGRPWEPDVEDYGLRLTEDSAAKRLRVGRTQDRLRSRRRVRLRPLT